jgi:AsmA family protein
MRQFFATHRRAKWLAIALGGFLLAVVLALAFFDWNLLRPMIAKEITAKTGRHASIDGDLKVHWWSWNPSVQINGISIDNPAWAARRVMFHADRLTISVSLRRLLIGQLVLPLVEVTGSNTDIERNAKGLASWEFGSTTGKPSGNSTPAKIPTVQQLIIKDGKLHVEDQTRNLIFSGALSAAEQDGKNAADAFQLRCTGSLNKKPFQAELRGGPLVNLTPDKPYDLSAHLRAADIALEARMSFPKPFDLTRYTAKFDLSGGDLADVFYLTGLALPNTPPYRLSANLTHQGTIFRMDDFKGRLGSSDIAGTVQIDAGGKRPKLRAKLHSKRLDIADAAPTLGHPNNATAGLSANSTMQPNKRAHAHAGAPTASPPSASPSAAPANNSGLLFPDADLQVNRVRGMDADVEYHAASVLAPKVPMKEVNFHLQLVDGRIKIDPLTFVLDEGRFSGSVDIDARKDDPETSIDMSAENIELDQFKSATQSQAPIQGSMAARLKIQGHGTSVHKLASNADGGLSVAIVHGSMSEVLAELTGIDVARSLGMLIAKDQKQAEIRCGVADFKAEHGSLASRTVFIDTTNVLITGRGGVQLGDEHLNLALQGDPKKLRLLRLRAPITVHGTLLHPEVGLKPDKLVAQTGAAVALATLLTPVAAALAFIDPGLAKDKDCAAVLSQAQADDTPPPPAPTRPAVSPSASL